MSAGSSRADDIDDAVVPRQDTSVFTLKVDGE
jgi:hypothetical protein